MAKCQMSATSKRVMTVALVCLLAGCAARGVEIKRRHIDAPFNEEESRAAMLPGGNTVTGSAFLRQNGGAVVTCAGATVHLIPATAYARERVSWLYGADGPSGMTRKAYTFDPDPSAYVQHSRTTRCDQHGNFEIAGLRKGTYYVSTTVTWIVAGTEQGGYLMALVKVEDSGAPTKVIMAF